MNEHLVIVEADLSETFSAVVEVPFVYIRQTRSGLGSRAVNGAMTSAGVGDVRVGARYWLLEQESGLRLYALAGLRLPTGGSDEEFTSQAGNRVDKDVAVQPGTGNLAGVLELGGTFSSPNSNIGFFASARYIVTPATTARSKNFRNQLSGNGPRRNSDPDSFLWKVGTSISIGKMLKQSSTSEDGEEDESRLDGLAFLLALSGAYVPYDDPFGDDDGFRRGALLIFVEPGLIYAANENITFNLSVPITAYRYVNKNGGNVPEIIFQAGVTLTFN